MGHLSEAVLYPDCRNCGAPGAVAVGLSNGSDRETRPPFHCFRCGETFRPEPDSDWRGVNDLPDRLRSAYVACEIRGLTRAEYTHGRGITEEGAKQRVQDARAELRQIRHG